MALSQALRISVGAIVLGLALTAMSPAMADEDADANRLFVEAMLAWEQAADMAGGTPKAVAERVALLSAVQSNLDEIINNYPGANLAVQLVIGEAVGPLSREGVATAADAARIEAYIAGVDLPQRPCAEFTDTDCLRDLAIRLIETAPDSADKTDILEGIVTSPEQIAGLFAGFPDEPRWKEWFGPEDIDPAGHGALDAVRALKREDQADLLFRIAVIQQDPNLVDQILEEELAGLEDFLREILPPETTEEVFYRVTGVNEVLIRNSAATSFFMLGERLRATQVFDDPDIDPLVRGLGLFSLSVMLDAAE